MPLPPPPPPPAVLARTHHRHHIADVALLANHHDYAAPQPCRPTTRCPTTMPPTPTTPSHPRQCAPVAPMTHPQAARHDTYVPPSSYAKAAAFRPSWRFCVWWVRCVPSLVLLLHLALWQMIMATTHIPLVLTHQFCAFMPRVAGRARTPNLGHFSSVAVGEHTLIYANHSLTHGPDSL